MPRRAAAGAQAPSLAGVAGLLLAVAAGVLLARTLPGEERNATELRDWRTGELWTCAAGVCQLND